MSEVVVRNSHVHDSSSVSLAIGTTQDIGFYPSDTATYIGTYFSSATHYYFWSSLNTVNTIDEALLENLISTGSVAKLRLPNP